MKNTSMRYLIKTPAARQSAAIGIVFLVLAVAGSGLAQSISPLNFYIATNGNDSWDGKSPTHTSGTHGPFASLGKAQLAVQPLAGTAPITVNVEGGTYYLALSPTNPGTLVMGTADSGTSSNPITWQNYNGQTPVVSGGVAVGAGGLGLTWQQVSSGTNGTDVWLVTLPASIQPFEYLFYTPVGAISPGAGPRRLRARLESSDGVGYYMKNGQCNSTNPAGVVSISLCNLATFLRVLKTVSPSDPNDGGCTYFSTATDGTEKCLDRFVYNPSDPIVNWKNLNGTFTGNPSGTGFSGPCKATSGSTYPEGDVGLTLTDAWTVDAMRVACLDTANNVIFLTGPTASGGGGNNYNFFGPLLNHRYMIENARDAFIAAQAAGQTGLWFLDRSTTQPVLYYIANSGESPNSDTVVIPQLPLVSTQFPSGGQFPLTDSQGNELNDYTGGSLIWATSLSFVTFKGITFEVDNFVPSYSTGFNNDVNGEMSVPQAIDCESCQNVTFDTITVRHISASAILVASPGTTGPPAQNDLIQNSAFFDLGDSGVRIGHRPSGSDVLGDTVNNVTVQNNLIDGYSRVFADGEGIAQGNGNTITYLHNDILDGYHAGISIGQLACPGNASGANCTNIISKYNHLRNMMQGITSDGGSLYYNVGGSSSSGTGNQILNNLVHDTTDSSIIDTISNVRVAGSGYGGQGIYLDAQSANVDVENNGCLPHVSLCCAPHGGYCFRAESRHLQERYLFTRDPGHVRAGWSLAAGLLFRATFGSALMEYLELRPERRYEHSRHFLLCSGRMHQLVQQEVLSVPGLRGQRLLEGRHSRYGASLLQ